MVRCSCVRVFVCSCVRVFVCSCVRVFVCSVGYARFIQFALASFCDVHINGLSI